MSFQPLPSPSRRDQRMVFLAEMYPPPHTPPPPHPDFSPQFFFQQYFYLLAADNKKSNHSLSLGIRGIFPPFFSILN